ncbi:hypothetical protein [Edaphobacter modestus]|uniref:Phosphate-selective porin O/P n=1 Tax=Edaphobacter modestus TaxID=388466 RepID=A0A4Q7YP41_9BACT|nr:hypothetical protein [Edaphobacter modestus]RZU39407.1 hypothetical protein BDD14_0790 [Edaphobacter modestus]
MRRRYRKRDRWPLALMGILVTLTCRLNAQSVPPTQDLESHAGHVPVISGGAAYIHNVNGGVTSLIPQINPVLLVPFGSHVLLQSRTDFTGFFQRENQTSGPFKGKVFKTVDYAQLDWFANTHIMVSAGKYLLPFGMYNERLVPIWIRNLADSPITASIGTRNSGAGDGFMLRGVATQHQSFSIQYSAYFSARSDINQLEAARTAGGDTSIFLNGPRLEVGVSYQRFLQQRNINSVATYISWQPRTVPLDLKAEGDFSYNGRGYWIESAYRPQQLPIPVITRKLQLVGRMQQFFPLHGGGNSLPTVDTNRVDFGLNYYFRDDIRIVSSYGRSFSPQGNANVWNIGATYRFLFPLWPARKK